MSIWDSTRILLKGDKGDPGDPGSGGSPVGSIVAWLKNYTNTPPLPVGWVECNGQVLTDSESVYNGQIIPNLNGDNRFLRGNVATGNIGGVATVTLTTDQIPSHNHNMTFGTVIAPNAGPISALTQTGSVQKTTTSTGGGAPHDNLPPYYNVVWIMRVK